MLSDAEKRELLENAASSSLRADFRRMREHWAARAQAMDMDDLLRFLSAAHQFCGRNPPRRQNDNYRCLII